MMTTERVLFGSQAWRRALAALLAVALALSGAGCATPGGAADAPATIEAVVIDAQRLARDDEMTQVRVWRGSTSVPVRPKMALMRGDLVQTGPNAYLVLRFPNADVYMRPLSEGRIGSLLDLVGEVFVKIRGAFAVETSFVRAGADGTAYLVRGGRDGAAVVTVFEGRVTLSSLAGAWAPQSLARGTTAYCPPRGGAPSMRPASEQELEQTRDWVERMEKLVPAPRSRYAGAAAVGVIGALVGAILLDRAHDRSQPGRGTSGGVEGAYPGSR